jgi:hypothetical protein
MDGSAFDRLTTTFTESRSRRGLSRLLGGLAVGGPLALVGSAEGEARKKKLCPPCKKRKKGKCRKSLPEGTACIAPSGQGGRCRAGRCVDSPPAATCSDGIRNGNESDVDCGGSCGRCPNGKRCTGPNDCNTAFCVNGACGYCPMENTPCGPGGSTTCICHPHAAGSALYCVDVTNRGNCVAGDTCPGDEVCVRMSTEAFSTCHTLCGAPSGAGPDGFRRAPAAQQSPDQSGVSRAVSRASRESRDLAPPADV